MVGRSNCVSTVNRITALLHRENVVRPRAPFARCRASSSVVRWGADGSKLLALGLRRLGNSMAARLSFFPINLTQHRMRANDSEPRSGALGHVASDRVSV